MEVIVKFTLLPFISACHALAPQGAPILRIRLCKQNMHAHTNPNTHKTPLAKLLQSHCFLVSDSAINAKLIFFFLPPKLRGAVLWTSTKYGICRAKNFPSLSLSLLKEICATITTKCSEPKTSRSLSRGTQFNLMGCDLTFLCKTTIEMLSVCIHSRTFVHTVYT